MGLELTKLLNQLSQKWKKCWKTNGERREAIFLRYAAALLGVFLRQENLADCELFFRG